MEIMKTSKKFTSASGYGLTAVTSLTLTGLSYMCAQVEWQCLDPPLFHLRCLGEPCSKHAQQWSFTQQPGRLELYISSQVPASTDHSPTHIPQAKMGLASTTYAEQLDFFRHGHALWFPEYEANIGDVGYIDEDGAFRRLFNVTFDAAHRLNRRGVPEGFVPLSFDHEEQTDIKPSFLKPGPLHSRSVTSRQVEAHIGG